MATSLPMDAQAPHWSRLPPNWGSARARAVISGALFLQLPRGQVSGQEPP